MTKTQTNELKEQYSAPSCKVVKTAVNRAILAGSYGTEDYDKVDGEWE